MSFTLTTTQVSSLKIITDTVKDLVQEVNLNFFEDRVLAVCQDKSHVTLIYLLFQKDCIKSSGEYRCDKSVCAGINFNSLNKIIKTLADDDTLTLAMQTESPDVILVRGQNVEKKTKKEYEIRLMDIDAEQIEIPDDPFDRMVSIESEEFTKIIKNLSVLDGKHVSECKSTSETSLFKQVAIETKEKSISFSSAGEIGRGAQTLEYQTKGKEGKEEDDDKLKGATSVMEEACTGMDVHNLYSLKYLQVICKAQKLCYAITLKLKRNWPLVIEYDVPSVGIVRFLVAPAIDGDDDTHPEDFEKPQVMKEDLSLSQDNNNNTKTKTLKSSSKRKRDAHDNKSDDEEARKKIAIMNKLKEMEKKLAENEKACKTVPITTVIEDDEDPFF